jgi:hypothetical protein
MVKKSAEDKTVTIDITSDTDNGRDNSDHRGYKERPQIEFLIKQIDRYRETHLE